MGRCRNALPVGNLGTSGKNAAHRSTEFYPAAALPAWLSQLRATGWISIHKAVEGSLEYEKNSVNREIVFDEVKKANVK